MPKDKLDKEKLEGVNFDYAYALYMNKNYDEANKIWETLLSSNNFYYKSASAYFLGKFYMNKNQKEKAFNYFKMVSDKASESKYANFCFNLLKK
jgi:tetratricopeptide (TPR) repeat protein